MEKANFSDEAAFNEALRLESSINFEARRKYEIGEMFTGRQYGPLPDSPEEAFEETLKREQIIINLAKTGLGERKRPWEK